MGPTDLTLAAAAMITSSGAGTTGLVSDLTPAQKRWIANDLTATMQLIYSMAPAIYKRPMGADMAAPVTSTLTATDGSDVVTTSYGFSEGCSVMVGGVMNEIRTEGGVKKLRFPFVGTSGSVAAVFYHDCVLLDSTVAKVIGPVSVVGSSTRNNGRLWTLDKLVNRAQVQEFAHQVATCRRYWVEPFLRTATTGGGLVVTGALTPSGAAGYYAPIGIGLDDTTWYVKTAATPFQVKYETGDAWYLSNVFSSPGLWQGPAAAEDGPAGTYTPFGGGGTSGTATVTVASASQESTLRLRILPIPDERITVSYDVSLRAPTFSVDDLGTDATPSTKTLVVADDYHALSVLPMFLQRWAGSPWVKAIQEQRKRLAEGDLEARKFLKEYAPQQECNRRMTAL